jgi:2'-5' RNA ligase
MRLFVAIELPDPVKQELGRLQEHIEKSCRSCPARWVTPGNVHLTLNFLGDVGASKLEDIKRAVAQTSGGATGFDLSLGELGAFPNLERPRVIWVGIRGDLNRLLALQKNLEQSISPLGIAPAARPFSPHLTLARIGDEVFAADKKRLGTAAAGTACGTDCRVPIRSVSLIRSQLKPGGPVYTVLDSKDLL